jgi:hypothetical protein
MVNDAGNRKEREPAREERLDRHFVGGVVNGRRATSGLHGLLRQLEQGEAVAVDRPKLEREHPREVQRRHGPGMPVGIQERMLDGEGHRRRAQLGEQRSIAKFHQPVHNALGVHDRVALFRLQTEEPLGLDELEPLVRQRGGVDRDLGSHGPIGVAQRVGRLSVNQALARPVAERAAAGREQNPPYVGRAVTLQALKNRVVFAVDRSDADAGGFGRRRDEFAGQDQDLLARERHLLARGQRGQGGLEPDGADHGDQDNVRLGQCRQVAEPADAAVKLSLGWKTASFAGGFQGRLVVDADVRDAVFTRDRRELVRV